MFTTNESNTSAQVQIFEKFADPIAFSQMVSRLMVTEIRRRASNKTTENASISIVEFLEISPTVNTTSDKKGWILLSTLNILVSFNSSQLLAVMASNSLPSTFVKCLYLFFDLPPCVDKPAEDDAGSDEYLSDTERRKLLQKVFSQLLTRICASPPALNDLIRRDDLLLLFNAITSYCPKHNIIWRQTAADVIVTMAKHSNVNIDYLHSKNCVNLFLENVQRIVELGTIDHADIVLMLKTFIVFLYEYNNSVNLNLVDTLLQDFSANFGYQFIVDFALKLEQKKEFTLFADLMSLNQMFTKIGIATIKCRPMSVNELFIINEFSIPKPSKGSLKNLKAFNIFVTLWSKSELEQAQSILLDRILAIYKEDNANYFITEGNQALSTFAEKLELKAADIQIKYYTLIEYIIFELNYVPCKELISLGIILKNRHNTESLSLCLKMLIKILKFNAVFRDVYREIGLLDIVCSLYSYGIQTLAANDTNEIGEQVLANLVELFIHVLGGGTNVNKNCTIFHECGASRHTFTLIEHGNNSQSFKSIRKRAFLIIQNLILSSYNEDILSQLLALLHRDSSQTSKEDIDQMLSLKQSVLKSLLVVLSENHRVRALFRKVGGFVSVISVIVHMEKCLSPNDTSINLKRAWNLLRCVFATLITAMRFEPANSKYFSQEICTPSFTDSLFLLGCFDDNPLVFTIEDSNDTNTFFDQLFAISLDDIPASITKTGNCCILMRLLYEMAIDTLVSNARSTISPESSKALPIVEPTATIVYPCIIISILHLSQYIPSKQLCVYVIEKVRRLLSLERNLQVMCDLSLITRLLNSSFAEIFLNEQHILYPQIQHIFERLSSHHIQPKDLRFVYCCFGKSISISNFVFFLEFSCDYRTH